MKTIESYINELKSIYGSDYKTAKILKISRESINQIRKRGTIADETAVKIADTLQIDRAEVLIAAAIARSKGDVLEAWLNVSKGMETKAGILFISQYVIYGDFGTNFISSLLC